MSLNHPIRQRAYTLTPVSRLSWSKAGRPRLSRPLIGLLLIHNEKRKTVYILCSIPLGIPIDQLMTWKQLTGDRRWSHALAECVDQEWDALPLAAKEMSRLFPSLWATKKAAERWIVKNPPEAYIDIIRVWGVLNTYRPPGQTSWSQALVRHGADPGEALAEVLGVPAEDIRVRRDEIRAMAAISWNAFDQLVARTRAAVRRRFRASIPPGDYRSPTPSTRTDRGTAGNRALPASPSGKTGIALDTDDNDDQVPGPVNFLMSPSAPAAVFASYLLGEGRAPDRCRRRTAA
jgi:hypothetical protein